MTRFSIASVFLAASVSASAVAGEAKGFSTDVRQVGKVTVPCAAALMKQPSKFYGMLDSAIHGYSKNLYDMPEAERMVYHKERTRFVPEAQKNMLLQSLDRSYADYQALSGAKVRDAFLLKKLQGHGISPQQVGQLQQICEKINPGL